MSLAVINTVRWMALVLGVLAWGSLHPARAAAYAEPQSFLESVTLGGGGGKFFTGSHAEGYTCQVCHIGASAPRVVVFGLPLAGYVPQQTYPITVDWDDELSAVGLNLEVTDGAGNRVGDLAAIEPAYLSQADLCVGAEGESAVKAFDLSNGRRVLTVARCGQTQTTFAWTAPAELSQAWFSGSVVSANRKKDVLGDGVANISIAFAGQGVAAPSSNQDLVARCGVIQRMHGSREMSPFAIVLTAATAVLCARARRRRAR